MAHAYHLADDLASCALALCRSCPFDRDSVRAHFLEEGGRGSGLEFPPKNVYITPNTPTLVQNILGDTMLWFTDTTTEHSRTDNRGLARARLISRDCLLLLLTDLRTYLLT